MGVCIVEKVDSLEERLSVALASQRLCAEISVGEEIFCFNEQIRVRFHSDLCVHKNHIFVVLIQS